MSIKIKIYKNLKKNCYVKFAPSEVDDSDI